MNEYNEQIKEINFLEWSKDQILDFYDKCDYDSQEAIFDRLVYLMYAKNRATAVVEDLGCDLDAISAIELDNGELLPLFREFHEIITPNGVERKYSKAYYISELEFYNCEKVDLDTNLSNHIEMNKFIKDWNYNRYESLKDSLDTDYYTEEELLEELDDIEYEYNIITKGVK